MGIDEQLVKEKRIQTKLINFSFEVFNANITKKWKGNQDGTPGD